MTNSANSLLPARRRAAPGPSANLPARAHRRGFHRRVSRGPAVRLPIRHSLSPARPPCASSRTEDRDTLPFAAIYAVTIDVRRRRWHGWAPRQDAKSGDRPGLYVQITGDSPDVGKKGWIYSLGLDVQGGGPRCFLRRHPLPNGADHRPMGLAKARRSRMCNRRTHDSTIASVKGAADGLGLAGHETSSTSSHSSSRPSRRAKPSNSQGRNRSNGRRPVALSTMK